MYHQLRVITTWSRLLWLACDKFFIHTKNQNSHQILQWYSTCYTRECYTVNMVTIVVEWIALQAEMFDKVVLLRSDRRTFCCISPQSLASDSLRWLIWGDDDFSLMRWFLVQIQPPWSQEELLSSNNQPVESWDMSHWRHSWFKGNYISKKESLNRLNPCKEGNSIAETKFSSLLKKCVPPSQTKRRW